MWENNLYTVKWKEKGGNVVTFENLDLLEEIGTLSEKLDPRNSSINTATMEFNIVNMEDRFSTFLYGKLSTSGKTFFRELVEIQKAGTIVYKGFVRSIKVKDAYEMKYSITLETVIGKLKTSLWEREFSEYLTETVAHINATRLAPGFSMVERVKDDETYRAMTYSGHIMDCMKGILQMALSQPNIAVNSVFLDSNYTNFLDVAVWQSIKDSLSSQIYTSYFEWTEPIGNIFDFLQKQIFMAIGVVPIIDNLGRIKMVVNQQPTESEGVKLLTHNEILKFNSKKIDESQVVNHLKIKYQKNDQDEYLKAMVKINAGSFAFFGNELIPEKPQEMEIDSINNLSRADQLTFMSNISDLLFSRFSRELNILSLKLPIQKGFDVQLGEFVQLDADYVIDWETGKRGLNPLIEGAGLIAKWNTDKWGGFIEGNSLGVAPDGTVIINTTEPRIWIDVFKVQCVTNHNKIKQWVINNV